MHRAKYLVGSFQWCVEVGLQYGLSDGVRINQRRTRQLQTSPPRYYIYQLQGALRSRGDLITPERCASPPLTPHSSSAATYSTRTTVHLTRRLIYAPKLNQNLFIIILQYPELSDALRVLQEVMEIAPKHGQTQISSLLVI